MAYENWSVQWDMPVIVDDRFRRTVYSSWGDAPGAIPYSASGGAAHEFYVDGSRGIMSVGTLDVTYAVQLATLSVLNFDITGTVANDVLPTGGAFEFAVRGRFVDLGNFVDIRMFPQTGNSVTYSLRQLLGFVETVGGTGTVSGVTATTTLAYHLQAAGSTLRAKIWDADDDEPQAWTVSMTTTMLSAGALYLSTYMVPSVSNARPIIIAWDDLLITTPERWVDVTSYVDTARGGETGSPFEIISGDTAEASADTGGFGLPLQNADQRWTPGNIRSPHYPNIAPGSQIRVRETIGDRVFGQGHGYVQYPEITAWTQSDGTSPRDQMITIPVVDRAAWIAQGRTFISTLGEHIIYNGGTALLGYWPMNESEGPDVNPAVGTPWTLTATRVSISGSGQSDPPSITFGSAGIPLADDISSISFAPSANTTDYIGSIMLQGQRPTSVTLDSDQVITVVCWTRPDERLSGAATFTLIEFNNYQAGLSAVNYASIFVDSSGNITAAANSLDWSGTVTGPPASADHPMLVAVRIGFDPAVLELWVRSEVYTGSLTVTTPNPAVFNNLDIADRYPGAVNHAQVYWGDPNDWTHDDFLAQYKAGLYGLERQSTGERIRTVLQYAGVDPSELGRIDTGASLMQVARLAGRNPMDVVAEAVETEQGEFYVAGNNQPVFADRIRLYNI